MSLRSFVQMLLIFLLLAVMPNSGCVVPLMDVTRSDSDSDVSADMGGADALVTIHMPFKRGYVATCTQGANGATSHRGYSTKHDLDLDTPNDRDDLVFAPISGKAYVHDDASNGFGRHVNISLGDGTYIVLGHLDEIFVANEMDVGLGQVIAFEGTTGYSSGDHVHVGRHRGDPALTADHGESIATLAVVGEDTSTQVTQARTAAAHVCALPGGHAYKSQLPDVRSHPDGTLVKSPYSADVYVLHEEAFELFDDESVFWSHNRSFADVVTVSDEELGCYRDGGTVGPSTLIRGGFDGTDVWLLLGVANDSTRGRHKVNAPQWQALLASWGVYAQETGELESTAVVSQYPRFSTDALWRDGAVVREEGRSDLYVTAGNIAFPILNWDVYTRMGFALRPIITVPAGTLARSVSDVGNCITGNFCVDHDFVERCGSSLFSEGLEDPGFGEGEEDQGGNPEDTDLFTDTDLLADTSVPPTSPVAGTLHIEWSAPGGVNASRITLSGVYAQAGVEGWWGMLTTVTSAPRIAYDYPNVRSGDYLRFSVEYVVGSVTTWSCVAPFPPGRMQGTATASWNGQALTVIPVADPGSLGCGLKVTVP